MLEALIARLDHWLATHRADYYASLLPGVTEAQLEAFEDQFSLKLPDAFRQFYSWRNGHDIARSESFQRNFMFTSLADIAHAKGFLDGMIGSDFENPRWWRRGWVPFLDNGGGDHLCLDVAAEDGGTPGQILMFYHDSERRPIRFTSMLLWLADLVESMESGTLKLA